MMTDDKILLAKDESKWKVNGFGESGSKLMFWKLRNKRRIREGNDFGLFLKLVGCAERNCWDCFDGLSFWNC